MNVSMAWLLYLVAFSCLLALTGILLLIISKYRHHRHHKKISFMRKYLNDSLSLGSRRQDKDFFSNNVNLAVPLFLELRQTLQFESSHFLLNCIRQSKIENYYQKQLYSSRKIKRITAAVYLSAIPSVNSTLALENALKKEQDYLVGLYLCNSLVDTNSLSAIPTMVNSIIGAPLWYRNKVSTLLCSFGVEFHAYIPNLLSREDIEIQGLLIDFAAIYPADDLKNYLLEKSQSPIKDISYRATRTIGIFYHTLLNCPQFLNNPDPVIRNITIQALTQITTKENIINLLPLLTDHQCEDRTIAAISMISSKRPIYLDFLIELFYDPNYLSVKSSIAKILSNRIEYLLAKLNNPDHQKINTLVGDMIQLGKINGLIGFLNKNKNIEIENEILAILRPIIESNSVLHAEFATYLTHRLLSKLNIEPLPPPQTIKNTSIEKDKLLFLYSILTSVLLFFPLIYVCRYWDNLLLSPWIIHLKQYVLDFNYYVAYYSIAINSIYLLLLFFSILGAYQQTKYWNLKQLTFLFKPRIMPSISIIAPAFREEATIIESVNSLLNLRYPNYELIIVNDGSTDNTLHKLITYFNLEKVDPHIQHRLKTKPVRGVYLNASIPKLIVIDKANGGKADSLNVGINISKKEYFCGIDADSLLEDDALLKLASMAIDSPHEAVALGGNILPINGCTVNKGMITATKIPNSPLARLQTIEYLRAFMAGRLGWAYLNCLLIISGAFGLFRKDRIIEIGGYLTSSERFQKDTVGEDMELVTRLSRHMSEKGLKHSIHYSYNANCWTEVPESLQIFSRQRDRWQRGLIDIMSFHRKLIFNPKYQQVGLVAMPYFFLFELVGPLIETQGYVMVILAIALGVFNQHIALLLFISSIMMGIIISIFSLLIMEKEIHYFSRKELTILILYSLIENFGPRQLISLWRISGYINSLKKPVGWGTMTRKGFATTSQTTINKN